MKILIDVEIPQPQKSECSPSQRYTIHDRVEEAIANIENTSAVKGNCELDWRFLALAFNRLAKVPDWDPELLEQIRETLMKYGIMQGPHAHLIEASSLLNRNTNG